MHPHGSSPAHVRREMGGEEWRNGGTILADLLIISLSMSHSCVEVRPIWAEWVLCRGRMGPVWRWVLCGGVKVGSVWRCMGPVWGFWRWVPCGGTWIPCGGGIRVEVEPVWRWDLCGDGSRVEVDPVWRWVPCGGVEVGPVWRWGLCGGGIPYGGGACVEVGPVCEVAGSCVEVGSVWRWVLCGGGSHVEGGSRI